MRPVEIRRIIKIALIIIIILALAIITYSVTKSNPPNSPPLEGICFSDTDCVPAECCHPNYCINVNYKEVCNELCTQECSSILDCNRARCGCENEVCTVIPNNP